MYKICKTERSAKRQRQIVDQMIKMLLHRPYDTISVRDLCEKAGVQRKVFYDYFECKKDLLYAIADFAIQDYPQENGPYKTDELPSLQKELEKLSRSKTQDKPAVPNPDGVFRSTRHQSMPEG